MAIFASNFTSSVLLVKSSEILPHVEQALGFPSEDHPYRIESWVARRSSYNRPITARHDDGIHARIYARARAHNARAKTNGFNVEGARMTADALQPSRDASLPRSPPANRRVLFSIVVFFFSLILVHRSSFAWLLGANGTANFLSTSIERVSFDRIWFHVF